MQSLANIDSVAGRDKKEKENSATMTVYTISQHEINQPIISLPPVLVGKISEVDYIYICESFRGVESEACCFGLLISMVLCICLTPLSLILCPCFVSCRLGTERKRIAGNLNLQLFRGFQVIEANDISGILIHTDRIPAIASTYVVAPISFLQQSQPVLVTSDYIQVQPNGTIAQPHHPRYREHTDEYSVTSPMAAAIPAVAEPPHRHPPPPRMMSVVIPSNVEPGQELRVNSPEGTFVNITIPEGVNPGETILVPY